jgi:hypothetical protein
MKWSGGPIVAQGRVSGFRQIERCSPDQLKQTTAGFSLFDLDEYWLSRPKSFFGMVIFLSNEEWLNKTIQPNERSYGSSWVILESKEKKKVWLPKPSDTQQQSVLRKALSKRTRTLPPSLRFEIFRRDSFTCVYCGSSGLGVKLTVDHKVPFSKGGSNEPGNLVTACWQCNIGKGAKSL